MSGKSQSSKSQHTNDGIPTVSRVAGDTIVELVYDPEARRTALAVSRFGGLWNIEREVRIQTGELLVPYTPTNNLIASECVLLPSKPEHHGTKAELIASIEAYLERYVDVSSTFVRIAAHYALLSWVYDAFSDCPYLRVQGDFGTGKTRALLAIGSILYKPFFASGASTVSPIFHILDRFAGSLVLDEADFRFSDATNSLVKILNNGTTRGLPVLRSMQNRDREFNPRAFKVFGPKIVAMRGSYDDAGLESRFISEEMGSRTLRDDIPLHLPETLRAEALTLRNRLLHFRFTHLFSTKIEPTAASSDSDPRVRQVTLPLLSLVDDPELRREMERVAQEQARFPAASPNDALVAAVSTAISNAFDQPGRSTVSVGEITRRVNESPNIEFPRNTKEVGSLIRREFGIATRRSNGVYVVSREAVALLAERNRKEDQGE